MLLPTISMPSSLPQSLIINYPTHFNLTSINITQFRNKKTQRNPFRKQKNSLEIQKADLEKPQKINLVTTNSCQGTVKLKRLPRYCFGQKIDMLERGWYVDDPNLFPANQHSVCPTWPGV